MAVSIQMRRRPPFPGTTAQAALPAPLRLAIRSIFEVEHYIDDVRVGVDFGRGIGVAEVIENAVFVYFFQEVVGVIGRVGIAGFDAYILRMAASPSSPRPFTVSVPKVYW